MSVQPLRVPKKAAPDPLRATLATEIAELDKAKRDLEAATDVATRMVAGVDAAVAKLDTAKADITAARDAQSAKLVASATNRTDAPTSTLLRDARRREMEAQDELDVARDALKIAEARKSEAELPVPRYQRRVRAAADAVLAGEINRLVDEASVIRDELIRRRSALEFLAFEIVKGKNQIPLEESRIIRDFEDLVDVRKAAMDFLSRGVGVPGNVRDLPGAQPWLRAHEELMRNADAPLPEN
ncbi:MAG: hypothetical protein QOJ15_3175 [Bradyrhizobium sp.]|jgi:hypothetical protein|nr:hypothetical protein [Bradyrhizobium sp.]